MPVRVLGPDGKTYAFPDGTDKTAAIRFFKNKGITSPASKPLSTTTQPGRVAAPKPPSFADKLLGPGTALDKATNAQANAFHHAVSAVTGPFQAALGEPKNGPEAAVSIYGPGALAAYRMMIEPTVQAVTEARKQAKAGNVGMTKDPYDTQGNYQPTAVSSAMDAIPVVGPWARNIENEGRTKGAAPALAGMAMDIAAPEAVGLMAPRVVAAASGAGGALKRAAANIIAPTDRLSSPLPDDPRISMRDHFNEAKDIGVNLDAAQATNAPIPKIAKRATENSLVGKGKFEKAAGDNVNVLHVEAENMLDRITPTTMSREEFGDFARKTLVQDMNARYTQASDVFDDLTKRNVHQPDMSGAQNQARQIIQDNADYYQKHPEMLKGGAAQAWAIVKNIAGDAGEAPADTWSDAHRLRSDIMDVYQSPDIVGSRAEGWLKLLAGRVDESMTGAGSGLSPNDLTLFENANKTWAQMKDTYDNPQSPFYSIVRAKEGLTAANSIAQLKPQAMQTLNDVAARTSTPDLVKVAQRQRVERILSPEGNDVPDLKNLPSRLKRADKEQLTGVLEPAQISDLDRLARVSKTVHADPNVSGSGKVAVAGGELAGAVEGISHAIAGNPAAAVAPIAYAAGVHGISKALTSPELTDALVNRSAPPPPKPSTPINPAIAVPVGLAAENQANQDDVDQGEKVVEAAEPDRGVQQVSLPTITPVTHPLGTVTGIDHDSGLPIVKREAAAPEPSPAADPPPPVQDTAPPPDDAAGPQASAEASPTPDTHIFNLAAWQAANPGGDAIEAGKAATDAGYEVA